MTALTKAERDALWAAPNSDVAKLLATCNALEAEIASLREAQDDQRRVLGNRIAELERERSDEWDAKHAAMRDRIEQLKDERDLLAAWIEWAREACSSRGSDTSPARAIFATDDEVRAWMEQRKEHLHYPFGWRDGCAECELEKDQSDRAEQRKGAR